MYYRFLLKSNGGYPKPNKFKVIIDGKEINDLVDRFLGIHSEEYDNLYDFYETYKTRIPENLLPIAHDPGGNLLCISFRGEYLGKIYFWDHENEVEENCIPDFNNVYLISQNFDSFLENLC